MVSNTNTAGLREKRNVFSSIRIKGSHKDMPYQELSFPALKEPSFEKEGSTSVEQAEIEALWMVGLLDHSNANNEKIIAKQLDAFLQLPGSTVLPRVATKHNRIARKRNEKVVQLRSSSDIQSNMTSEEQMRLRALGKRLKKKRIKNRPLKSVSPYEVVNAQLEKVVHKERIKSYVPLKSTIIDRLFQVNQVETKAAISIQKLCRKYLALKLFRSYIILYRKARIIQTFVRGCIIRRWFCQWRGDTIELIIICQSCCRRYIAQKKWKAQCRVEFTAAVMMQSQFRKIIALRIVECMRRQHAATKVQSTWRGWYARYLRIKLTFDRYATTIQSCTRRCLAKVLYSCLFKEKASASLILQRCWRGFSSRQYMHKLLFDRSIEQRKTQVCLLEAEEQYWSEVHAKLETRLCLPKLRSDKVALTNKVNQIHDRVIEDERNHAEMTRERECLSPRAIGEGWDVELDKGIEKYRNDVTNGKLELLLGSSLRLRHLEESIQTGEESLRQARLQAEKFSTWREEELKQLWRRQQKQDQEDEERALKIRRADERRKWAIAFYRSSGKPDKMRRPGRPWDPRVYKESSTFCPVSSDTSTSKTSMDRVHNLVDQIKMQSCQNQHQLFEKMLHPLSKVVQGANIVAKTVSTPSSVEGVRQMNDDETTIEADTFIKANAPTQPNLEAKVPSRTPVNSVPWIMLDQLAAEKHKLAMEKAFDSIH